MERLERLEIGRYGVIRETEDGRIQQIGLNPMQSDMLQEFLSVISTKANPLVGMDENFDLVSKFKCCAICQTIKNEPDGAIYKSSGLG